MQLEAAELLRLQHLALEASANAIVITDNQGTVVWANAAFSRLTGYDAKEVMGKALRFLKSGRHPPEFYQDLWGTILQGRVWQGLTVNRHKNGSLYVEQQTITPVRNSSGAISHFIAVKEDVTRREEAERSLQESEKLYRTLMESGVVGVWHIRPSGETLFVNRAMLKLLEAESVDQLAERPFQSFFTQESEPWVAPSRFSQALSQPMRCRVDLVGLGGKRRTVLISGTPLMNGNWQVQSVINAVTDITGVNHAP